MLICSHIVNLTTLECVLVHSIVFLFYILYTRAVEYSVDLRGFLPQHKILNPINFFWKYLLQCIPFCSCVWLKLSFKMFGRCFNFPLRGAMFRNIGSTLRENLIRIFNPLWPGTYKLFLAFGAVINFNAKLS